MYAQQTTVRGRCFLEAQFERAVLPRGQGRDVQIEYPNIAVARRFEELEIVVKTPRVACALFDRTAWDADPAFVVSAERLQAAVRASFCSAEAPSFCLDTRDHAEALKNQPLTLLLTEALKSLFVRVGFSSRYEGEAARMVREVVKLTELVQGIQAGLQAPRVIVTNRAHPLSPQWHLNQGTLQGLIIFEGRGVQVVHPEDTKVQYAGGVPHVVVKGKGQMPCERWSEITPRYACLFRGDFPEQRWAGDYGENLHGLVHRAPYSGPTELQPPRLVALVCGELPHSPR